MRGWLVIGMIYLLAGVRPAGADEHENPFDHEAGRALRSGEILPLARILELVGPSLQGRVIETELEREHGRWIYEFHVLEPAGGVAELKADARTGAVLAIERPDDEGHERREHGR